MTRYPIPPYVRRIMTALLEAGHEAYLVGGCVRDLLLETRPKDWDVATSAWPKEVMALFPRTVPTGARHGTVTVIMFGHPVEVTTFRTEWGYSDHRRPDQVKFTRSLKEDLTRRDLTVNAMAMTLEGQVIDYYGGRADLAGRLLRAVGRPEERFEEDALRMMRTVRFAAQLGFSVEDETFEACKKKAPLIEKVSRERIRDELSKMLLSDRPGYAMELLRITGLLEFIIPELLEGVGCLQNEHHKYPVWEHSLIALDAVPPRLELRLAALLHDIAKPRCLTVENGERHFYHHENVGADMAWDILRRLRFDNHTVETVTHLIRQHMALHYQPDMTDSAVRRLIRRVGLEYIGDLIELRRADREASGLKEGPVSRGTRKLLRRIEKVLEEDAAFGLKDLVVNGHDVMEKAGIGPGPAVGEILNYLLEQVLENPELNERETLLKMIEEKAREMGL